MRSIDFPHIPCFPAEEHVLPRKGEIRQSAGRNIRLLERQEGNTVAVPRQGLRQKICRPFRSSRMGQDGLVKIENQVHDGVTERNGNRKFNGF